MTLETPQLAVKPNLIKRYRQQAGMTLEALAQEMGVSRSQVHKLERGERRLTVEWIFRLAKVLRVKPQDLLPEMPEDIANENQPYGGTSVASLAGAMDLPVYGSAESYDSHRLPRPDMTARPSALQGANTAFAVYMGDDSMTPRYYAGEMLFVKPSLPVTNNCYALIELKTGRSMVAQVLSRSPEMIVVRRFNPATKNSIPMNDVASISAIIGCMEA